MKAKLKDYLNGVFIKYQDINEAQELKHELLLDLEERFDELKAQGHDHNVAFGMTIGSIGEIEDTVSELPNFSKESQRKLATNFTGHNLSESDFSNIIARNSQFKASILRKSNFNNADLTGSDFRSSDISATQFISTNLTNCNMSTAYLNDAIFDKSIMTGVILTSTSLENTKFIDCKFIDVNFTTSEVNKATFEKCSFYGVNFKLCDLRNTCFDDMVFNNVKFDNSVLAGSTFKGSRLQNISFYNGSLITGFVFSKKFAKDINSISFQGAFMDKITYNSLKSFNINLDEVVII